MKTSILQMPIQLGDFRTNLETLHHMLASAMEQRPDVVLLPELWDIGYYPHPISEHADPNGERIRKALAELAAKYQVNIVGGSTATRSNDNIFNTNYVFNRNGQLVSSYEKTHLFAPGGEKYDFTPGDRLTTYTIDGIKCATLICYDIRFPEAARCLALEDIAVLFVPAAWPASRIMHWNTLLRARAIENEFFIVAANGTGELDDGMHLGGHSQIIDPWGEILASTEEGEATLQANLKIAIRGQIHESINVFADRRPEVYHIKK